MYKDKYYSKYAYLEGGQGVFGEVDQNGGRRVVSPVEITDGSFGAAGMAARITLN
jgi:hypothetical protein